MKGRNITYAPAELAWIKANSKKQRRNTHAAFLNKFNRGDVSLNNFNALCKRKGWLTGRTGRFENGQISHNKGKKMPFNANSAKTQFKKGNAPHNTKHLNHRRTTKDGYIEVSVLQKNKHTGFCRTYVLEHRHRWEKLHGPIPPHHFLKCLNGNRADTEPSNWAICSNSMKPRLSGRWSIGYDMASPKLKSIVMTIAQLEEMSRKLQSKAKSDAR